MGNLINLDQTAAVIGRSIHDNFLLLRNIIHYSNQKGLKCIILSLDQAKAFDRVSHNYMIQVLKNYGFGEDLLKWVKLLYTDICINGYLTYTFPVERSVPQGCSLSPLLYVLCIEPFASRIRSDQQIKGFIVPGGTCESRISMYADCSFTVLDLKSLSKILNIADIYGLASVNRCELLRQLCEGCHFTTH